MGTFSWPSGLHSKHKAVAFVENFNEWRNAAILNEWLMGMTAEELMNR